MPPVPGWLAAGARGDHQRVRITVDLYGYDESWVNNLRTYRAGLSPAGAVQKNLPVDAPSRPIAGWIARSFSHDYYYRVHVTPRLINFSSIVTQTTVPLYVWNAHFEQRTLLSITQQGQLDGVSLSGQPAPPLAYAPLQERTYSVTASLAGAATIDGSYVFAFGTEAPAARVTGQRVVVWAFGPDWSEAVVERLEWATQVLARRDGSEQRVRLRAHARRRIEYGALVHARQMRALQHLLHGWGARTFLLPVWWEADVRAAPLPAGSTTVTVTDAALKDYRVGGYAAIAHEGEAEAAQIAQIAGNVLTFAQPLARSWPVGARVMPAVFARLEGEAALRRHTPAVAAVRTAWQEDERTARDRAAQEIGPTFSTYAVLDERPDWVEEPADEWGRALEVLDSLTGMAAVEDATGHPIIRRTMRWLIYGRVAIDRWKRWAAARAGALRALWLPSWVDELALVQPIGAGDTSVRVAAEGAARYVGASPLRAALRIELLSGVVYHRLVTGVSNIDAATDAIAIDSPLGANVTVADVRRIMWLSLARLDADAVELRYETDSTAVLQATFRQVLQ